MTRDPSRIFLSGATGDFGPLRSDLADDLRVGLCHVIHQGDFPNTSVDTVLKLAKLIGPCGIMIHMVGPEPGSPANSIAVAEYIASVGGEEKFLVAYPDLRAALGDFSDITYTQWEAYIALHLGIDLVVYADATQASPAHLQRRHLDFLRQCRKHAHAYPDTAALNKRIIVDLFAHFRLSVPATKIPSALKPANLPGGYIGRTFLGRDEFLKTLRQSLLGTGHATAITQKSAATGISGLGGIGKTHVAVEYAHRHRDDYTALLFASGDTPEKLNSSLANLCGVLHPDEIDKLPPEEPARIRTTLRWLATQRDWLLIIDNVDDEPAAKAVQEILGQLTTGHVIITSRLHGWSDQVKNIDLDVLSETSSIELLLNLTADRRRLAPDDETQALQLAQLLEGLPLAIHQAAGYINEQIITLAQYVTRYENEAADLLSWFSDLSIPYERPEKLAPKPVLITWKTCFEKLSVTDQMWISLFSLFAPDPIPEFLLEPHENTTSDQNYLLRQGSASIARAEKYCLLTRSCAEPTFKIHRLVQQITRFKLTDEDVSVALELAISLIIMAEPGDPSDALNFPSWNSLQPHAAFLCQQASDDVELTNLVWLVSEIGLLLQSKGDYADAEKYFRRALRICRATIDADDPYLAISCLNLGSLLQVLNQMSEAESLIREALFIDRAAFGDASGLVSRDLNNLARLLQDTGRHDEAEAMMREILKIDRTLFGPAHPISATNLNNLAGLLQKRGRLDEAEPLMRQSLTIDLEALGSDHPSVARDMNNLATLLHEKKNTVEAEPMARESLRIERAVFGDKHPNVARGCGNLASMLFDSFRILEAEPLMREALEIARDTFGSEHPNVALHLNNLGLLLAATSRLPEAETRLREALRIFKNSLGPENPKTVGVSSTLDNLFLEVGHMPPDVEKEK